MKLILIKIGKIFSTIKRDGIIVGGRRVLEFIRSMARTIRVCQPGDVLIITGGIGDSAFYRAHNQAEELNIHGIKTSVMIQDNPFLPRYAGKFNIFIFHRTLYTSGVAKLLERVKKQNKEIIFETDDLVFDKKYIQNTDLYKNKMSVFERMQYAKGVGEEILKDSYVKVAVTTTSYLANELEKYGKKVFISKNKISNHELDIAEKILAEIPKQKGDSVRIGYFSGTHSHNLDFASITKPLSVIMEKFSNARLILAGPLDVENELNRFKGRIITLPMAPRDKYYKNLWLADINLAPLVAGDPFCEAKSELKFFEPGILKIPTVAVRNQTFSEAITDGVDGFLASTEEEWIERIGRLIRDENLRRQMGEKAREKVLANYTNLNSRNKDYYDYLRNIIEKND